MTRLAAVDSGGTHTNIRVFDTTTDETVNIELGRSLSSNRSDKELRDVLAKIFTALRANDIGEPEAVWISAAGYAESSRIRLEKLLSEFMGSFAGCVGLCNDGVTLLLANEPELVSVVAGTGSVAMARSEDGDVIVRGGDEWVVADYGSAFWLGLEGIRAAYVAHEGGAETGLLACLIEHYRPLSAEEDERSAVISEIARDLARAGTNTKPVIASFAPQVTRQAELGDEVARAIVRGSVDELAASAVRVYRQLISRATGEIASPRFLVAGSPAYSSRYYSETFAASLDAFLFDIRETLQCEVEVEFRLNGVREGLVLAERIAAGEAIPELDRSHPYSLFGLPTERRR